MALGGDAGTTLDEVVFHLLEQIDASVSVLGVDVAGQVEVLHLEGGLVAGPAALLLREVLGRVADDQRSVLRAEEARIVRGWAELPERGDADEVRQGVFGIADLLGDEGAKRRILDRAGRQVAGAHQEGSAAMVAFLGRHRADDRHLVAELGDLGQVFANLQAGSGGLDLLERPAVGVADLEVPQVDGAGPTVHPQQDHGLLALRMLGGIGGEGVHPAGNRAGGHAGGGQFEPLTAGQAGCIAAASHRRDLLGGAALLLPLAA